MNIDPNDLKTVATILGETGIGAVTLNFINKVLGPTADDVGKYVNSRLKQLPVIKQINIYNEASKIVAEAGASPKQVDPGFILNLMESAALEKDEEISKKWAALLANASIYGESVSQITFIDILRQLSPYQAYLLEELNKVSPGESAPMGQLALFGNFSINPFKLNNLAKLVNISYLNREGFNNFLFAIDNLIRLRLIIGSENLTYAGDDRRSLETSIKDTIAITYLGYSFLTACNAPDL